MASLIVLAIGTAVLVWLILRDVTESAPPAEVDVEADEPWFEVPAAVELATAVEFRRASTHIVGFREYDFPFLADEDPTVSLSVGTVTNGFVVNAREIYLPQQHLSILPRQLLRNLRFGTGPLIAMLQRSADQVARELPGAAMWLGNIGKRGGGDIPFSVSHNSGRDADVAFYLLDTNGQPVAPPDLFPIGQDLTATRDDRVYRFDVDRNWALVKAFLSFEETQIQFVFVANHLKQAMLDHARLLGERPELIARAEAVLTQPGRRNPHDDHFHVRIYCSRADVEGGCVNLGRAHPWADLFEEEKRLRIRQLHRILDHDDAEQRARAIERLVLLRSRSSAGRIAERLADDSPRAREAAARALGELGTRRQVDALVAACRSEADPAAFAAMVASLGILGGDDAQSFVTSLLDAPERIVLGRVEMDRRALVVDALALMTATDAVDELIALLDTDDAYLRARASWALGRLTNTRFGSGWEDPTLDSDTRDGGEGEWRSWFEQHGTEPRESWLISGFAHNGISVIDGGVDLTAFVEATTLGEAYLRYNAQRALMNLLDRQVPSLLWSAHDAAWYWREAVGGI